MSVSTTNLCSPAVRLLLATLLVPGWSVRASGQPNGQPSAQPSDAGTAEQRFEQAIREGRFELASKIAIAQFRPDLHCRAIIARADERIRAAEALIRAADLAGGAEITEARQALDQARAILEQATTLANDYMQVGQEAVITEHVTALLQDKDAALDSLIAELEERSQQAAPLETLVTTPSITDDQIQRQAAPAKLILGLLLVDRGQFEQAGTRCFEAVQLEGPGTLKTVATYLSTALAAVQGPPDGQRWRRLVDSGLDNFEALQAEHPDQLELAGWLLCWVARLARDHYDVPDGTVRVTLELLADLELPEPAGTHHTLLAAKLRHERFLLSRRGGRWHAAPPPHEDLVLFKRCAASWVASEAALIAAASTDRAGEAAGFLEQCTALIEALSRSNPRLGEAMNRRVRRYRAASGSLAEWLALAQDPACRDRRGTLMPDVLTETRGQLSSRVRRDSQSTIARLIDDGRLDGAFREAQKAKALSVGRTLAPQPRAAATPISETQLLASKLLTMGESGEGLISHKELFIEYFVGPDRAWAFYLFAPGDPFEGMRVVELDHGELHARCRQAIAALRQNRSPPDKPEDWLLGAAPRIADLWNRLDDKIKKPHTHLRRVVIAPDGPLCYLPLHPPSFSFASSVTYVPTAAVLLSSEYLDPGDVQAMWDIQRGNLLAQAPVVKRRRNEVVIRLWPGMDMPILLRDATE